MLFWLLTKIKAKTPQQVNQKFRFCPGDFFNYLVGVLHHTEEYFSSVQQTALWWEDNEPMDVQAAFVLIILHQV